MNWTNLPINNWDKLLLWNYRMQNVKWNDLNWKQQTGTARFAMLQLFWMMTDWMPNADNLITTHVLDEQICLNLVYDLILLIVREGIYFSLANSNSLVTTIHQDNAAAGCCFITATFFCFQLLRNSNCKCNQVTSSTATQQRQNQQQQSANHFNQQAPRRWQKIRTKCLQT